MKALQIIESAYRCTVEEQDDPAVWIAHAMKNSDADIGVLLRGNAVNYAVGNQDASGLAFGDLSHAHAPRIDSEIQRFIDKGVDVHLVREDMDERGIGSADLIAGIQSVSRDELPGLFAEFDQVWHW